MLKDLKHTRPSRTRAAFAWCLASVFVSGCATGDFSTPSVPVTPEKPPANSNPPSLPALKDSTAVNDYVGTEMPGPYAFAPENTVALHLDGTALTYTSTTVPVPQAPTGSLPDSSGTLVSWANYWNLGDNTGANGLPGLQEYGLAIEVPSRLAFLIASAGSQIAAMTPLQTSGCITPTAAATYQFITMFGANFNDATDTAYGTVQVLASGTAFEFSGDKQFTHSKTTATTGLVPFGSAKCIQSSDANDLGYFIDTPATDANGNTEIRAFLGPTGLLAANLQDAAGDPLPGLVAMVQPSTSLDANQLAASTVLYRAIEFEFGGAGTQWGYAEHHSDGTWVQAANPFDALSAGFPDLLQLASSSSPSTISFSAGFPTISLSLGAPDNKNPGLFSHARFVYNPGGDTCPAGTQLFSVTQRTTFCSSPAIAMAGQHDGKFVVLITGTDAITAFPTFFILVQN